MTSDPQQEYVDALPAYHEVLAGLREAKRRIPPSPRDRRRQRLREKREAERADYLANKDEAADADGHKLTISMITAKVLAILHQKCNFTVNRTQLLQLFNDDHE